MASVPTSLYPSPGPSPPSRPPALTTAGPSPVLIRSGPRLSLSPSVGCRDSVHSRPCRGVPSPPWTAGTPLLWPPSRRGRAMLHVAAANASVTPVGSLEGSRLPSQFQELGSQEDLVEVLQNASHLVLVEWMAQWCRKCIYLKPKIERIVHEYPSVRCCVVDVNKVPFSFVKSANISKMPTLQLYLKGQLVEELVGGEAAWQVLDKVREMIKRHV